jgi:hypothetical protein
LCGGDIFYGPSLCGSRYFMASLNVFISDIL